MIVFLDVIRGKNRIFEMDIFNFIHIHFAEGELGSISIKR